MIAVETATRHNEEPSEVLDQVERGATVMIQKHGEIVAVMIPMPRRTSGSELARRMKHLEPMPDTAAEMEAIIKGMDDASRKSFPAH